MTSIAIIREVLDWLEYNGRRENIGKFLVALNSYVAMRKLRFYGRTC